MHKIIKNLLRNLIEKHCKVWGIDIITKLPPEFVVTEHAYKRMTERLNIKKEKINKITIKAWKSKEPVDSAYIYRSRQKYGRGIYRMFNGMVFVFVEQRNYRLGVPQKYLVTVFIFKGWQYH